MRYAGSSLTKQQNTQTLSFCVSLRQVGFLRRPKRIRYASLAEQKDKMPKITETIIRPSFREALLFRHKQPGKP